MDNNGQPFFKETRYAEVNLIHIPFVSIREQLSPDLLKEPKDPATLMLSLIREEAHRLVINLISRFGPYALKDLEITSVGTRPNTRYGIMMDKNKIEIVF